MREILFRGKRKDNGEWVYGNLFIPDYEYKPTEILIGTNVVRISYEVIPETVGQYTGREDVNDVRIFEGDIIHIYLRDKSAYRGFDWGNKEVVYKGKEASFGIYLKADFTPLMRFTSRTEFEVIGNIHDNPELLKENK